jgi:hypothetical protein
VRMCTNGRAAAAAPSLTALRRDTFDGLDIHYSLYGSAALSWGQPYPGQSCRLPTTSRHVGHSTMMDRPGWDQVCPSRQPPWRSNHEPLAPGQCLTIIKPTDARSWCGAGCLRDTHLVQNKLATCPGDLITASKAFNTEKTGGHTKSHGGRLMALRAVFKRTPARSAKKPLLLRGCP